MLGKLQEHETFQGNECNGVPRGIPRIWTYPGRYCNFISKGYRTPGERPAWSEVWKKKVKIFCVDWMFLLHGIFRLVQKTADGYLLTVKLHYGSEWSLLYPLLLYIQYFMCYYRHILFESGFHIVHLLQVPIAISSPL